MRLSFHGATQTVTGSRYLLQCPAGALLVDCGLFQGYKALRLENWNALPFDARVSGLRFTPVIPVADRDHPRWLRLHTSSRLCT